jgi:hypothetical protein
MSTFIKKKKEKKKKNNVQNILQEIVGRYEDGEEEENEWAIQ